MIESQGCNRSKKLAMVTPTSRSKAAEETTSSKEGIMAKHKIKHLTGVMASLFSHIGHISKEDAKEISGLDDHEFNKAYEKAAGLSEKILKTEGNKMDAFIEHMSKEIDAYFSDYGGKTLE
jgi:hypothetical protein